MASADDRPALPAEGWRGDDHLVRVEAAKEAGLPAERAALESFTRGFSAGMTLEDPYDAAVVARGRTVLSDEQLAKTVLPALHYLGVARQAWRVRVHDGEFELRIDKAATGGGGPTIEAAKLALRVLLGAGVLGLALYQLVAPWLASIVWGVGLVLGARELRRGLATGRAMLSARLAIGLAMIAAEQGLVLPPAGDDPERP